MYLSILSPHLGLTFWTLLIFLLFFFILAKFAWKPIIKGIKQREESITEALQSAEKAREEMAALSAENEALLKAARIERDQIIKEAKGMRDQIVAKSKEEAQIEAQRLLKKAKEEIQAEKMAALTEIKNQVGLLSVDIAEKILRKELEQKSSQQEYIDKLVGELQLS